MNQKKKKAFALTQQDRELIPRNIEQPHVSQIDSISGEKKIWYGIENCGAAIGDEYFITDFIDKRVSVIIGDMEKVSQAVSEMDPQSAFPIRIFSFQRKAECLLATHLPSQTKVAASRLDSALERVFKRALGVNVLDPIRNYEMGANISDPLFTRDLAQLFLSMAVSESSSTARDIPSFARFAIPFHK